MNGTPSPQSDLRDLSAESFPNAFSYIHELLVELLFDIADQISGHKLIRPGSCLIFVVFSLLEAKEKLVHMIVTVQ